MLFDPLWSSRNEFAFLYLYDCVRARLGNAHQPRRCDPQPCSLLEKGLQSTSKTMSPYFWEGSL